MGSLEPDPYPHSKDASFASLLKWHLDFGTRPQGLPHSTGQRWTQKEFADSIKTGERAIRSWLTGRVRPVEIEAIEQALFGKNSAYAAWQADLRAAHKKPSNPIDELPISPTAANSVTAVADHAHLTSTPTLSPMIPIVDRLERGERVSAMLFLALEIGLFIIGCAVILATFFVPLASGKSSALITLTGACLTGIGVTIRGMHRDAVVEADKWAGMHKAYETPNLPQPIMAKMDEIVFERLRRGPRNAGPKSGPNSREPAGS